MEPDKTPVKVLYIMGAGRSGSTLLDMVLGSHPEVRGAGELTNAARNGWLKNEDCSCGKPVNDCPFWSEVLRLWTRRGFGNLERYVSLQDIFERYRNLPRLLRERRSPSPEFLEYAGATRAFFDSIREAGEEQIVVDSSKSPARALALSMVPGVDLHLVHLTRDGRGVAASLNRSWRKDEEPGVTRDVEGKPVWRTAAFWIVVNLTSEWVGRRLGPDKFLRVRYEDLVMTPSETLAKIGNPAHVDYSQLVEQLERGGTVEAEHNIAGNRLRMSENVRLKPDPGSWKKSLSEEQKWITWTLMGWLQKRYGYKR
ncbi:MAG: sulfotransferase [Rubrobacteraceae bacterium]